MNTNTQLFEYINKQEWPNIKKLIDETTDIDLNIRDDSNNYLIQFIVIYNKYDLIDIFVEKKCKIDIIDNDGKTLLYYAIKYNYYNLVEKLLNITYIGFPINELKDKNKLYPIHYSIIFNNQKILELLINKGSDINLKDGNGNTPLMTAIKQKNYKIAKFLIEKSQININSLNSLGETALHIACNYELENIVELIIQNKDININVQDYQNKYTPLMYSVALNNFNISSMLLNYPKNNLLIQDSLGSTAFHHAIVEDTSEDLIKLIDDKLSDKKELDHIYNITNINGNTLLHLILEKNIQINLKKYIINTNLNIQNSSGNTIWHIFGKRWYNYIAELENKKNNLFIKNRKNETAFDKYKDSDKFMEMLIKSYYNYLKTKKREWKNDWENICRNNDLVKKLDFKDNSTEKNCYEKIKKHIVNEKISVPYKKVGYCLSLDNNPMTDFITYTGTSLDILSGLLYIKQFENVFTTLNKKFIINEDLSEYYKVLGIIKEIKGEYMNFEITWLYQKIFFPTNMDTIIQNFKDSKKRFFIIPLGILQDNNSQDTSAHANILLYDSVLNEIERFEPSGSEYPLEFNYNPDLLDYYLENYFAEKFKDVKFFKPRSYEMNIGFQTMEIVDINKKIGDPGGFCAAWSLWWVYQRIKNENIERKKLFLQLVKNIRRNNLSFKNVIRSFSKLIIDIRDSLLKKVSLDINKWLNDDFDYDTFDRFNSIIEKIVP
jgi:ankyrin repeat protein